MQYGFNAKTQRGQPQPNTRFEQEATEETERWTMSSDALFSLFSPVQSILFQRSNSTAWHGTPQPKPCRKGPVRAGAEGAEKESLADLLSRCCSALSAFSARNKILATMRDADGLQCRERGEKVLPKMQTSPTLQCRVARAASEFGPMANAHHFLVGRITEDKFLFASSYLSAFALKFFCLTAWMRLRA
jgi:hypothetical protein